MQKLVSVIVPVYNVEKYLDTCIKSVFFQTYKNWELILIDDGSTDTSPEICDKYSNRNNVKVIHQVNRGLSNARNVGVKVSIGEYIYFVDSDDYLEEGTLAHYVKMMESNNLDIAFSNLYITSEDGLHKRPCSRKSLQEDIVMLGEDYLAQRILCQDYFIMVYLGMYRSSFLKNNNLYFCEVIVHEDEEWSPKTIIKAKRVMYSNKCFYNYVQHCQSITKASNKLNNLKSTFYICDVLEKFFTTVPLVNSLNRKYYLDMLARLYMSMSCCGNVPAEYYKQFDKQFPRKYAYFPRTKKMVFLYCINIKLYRWVRKFMDWLNHIKLL